jgi:hypothetical protein
VPRSYGQVHPTGLLPSTVVKIGRNDRCPCGSGAKYKRCCGASAEQAERLARSRAALEEAAELPRMFPHLRAEGEAISAFAERVAAELAGGELSAELVAEGIALLDDAERTRIVETVAREQPEAWKELERDAVKGAEAETALVGGAVRVAVESRSTPPRHVLHAIESSDQLRDHSFQALALTLPSARLWSIEDAMDAGDASVAARGREAWLDAVADVAEERWSAWHDARLAELVANLDRHLPDAAYPRASAVLAEACAELEHATEAAQEVATVMLANYLVLLVARDAQPDIRRGLLAAAA